jgi:IMP dehydrogenase/GMP reductase
MLHRAMRSVLHWRTAMAIEMARDGGIFVCLPPPILTAVIVAKDHVKVH